LIDGELVQVEPLVIFAIAPLVGIRIEVKQLHEVHRQDNLTVTFLGNISS
jgi:hypothetical protein